MIHDYDKQLINLYKEYRNDPFEVTDPALSMFLRSEGYMETCQDSLTFFQLTPYAIEHCKLTISNQKERKQTNLRSWITIIISILSLILATVSFLFSVYNHNIENNNAKTEITSDNNEIAITQGNGTL